MRPIVCPRCDGKGKSVVIRGKDHLTAMWYVWQECSACRGSGYQANALSTNPLYPDFLSLTTCLTRPKSLHQAASRTPALTGIKF